MKRGIKKLTNMELVGYAGSLAEALFLKGVRGKRCTVRQVQHAASSERERDADTQWPAWDVLSDDGKLIDCRMIVLRNVKKQLIKRLNFEGGKEEGGRNGRGSVV